MIIKALILFYCLIGLGLQKSAWYDIKIFAFKTTSTTNIELITIPPNAAKTISVEIDVTAHQSIAGGYATKRLNLANHNRTVVTIGAQQIIVQGNFTGGTFGAVVYGFISSVII